MDSVNRQTGLPQGPATWPPDTAWPAPVHAGVGQLKALAAQWQAQPDDSSPIMVAVSGGADSLALAVVASETQRVTRVPFGAIVLDHRLQDVTAQVAQVTAQICTTLGLGPVITDDLDITARGEGTEAAARQARYEAFVAAADAVHAVGVVTAHTADDQAEQVLLGLARGSGLRSVAGITRQRKHVIPGFGPVRIGRPLLELSRDDTEAICSWAGLRYFEDPMNFDHSVARIRVRENLLPALADPQTGLGPGVFTGLVRTAALAADDAEVLDDLAADTYRELVIEEHDQTSFLLAQLQALKPAILRRVVAIAVQRFGAPQPSAERLWAIEKLVFPPVGRASSAGPIQLEGHVSLYRKKTAEEYVKLLVIRSDQSD